MQKNNRYIFLSFLFFAFIYYYKSLGVYFLSDDLTQMQIMNKFGLAGITHNFDIAFIRPMPYIHMAIMHAVFGHTSAMPYHFWNIVLHATNAYLVYLLYMLWVKRYFFNSTPSYYPGIIAGFLFLALPYQTEAVTWVAATVDLVVTTWSLLTIVFYFKWRTENKKRYFYWSIVIFFLALMSKEAALFIPVLIFMLECFEHWPIKNYLKPFKTMLLYCSWLPLYIFMRYYFLGELIGGYHEMHTTFIPSLIIYNAALYTAKFFVLYRLLPHELKYVLKFILYNRVVLIACIAVTLAIIIYFRRRLVQIIFSKGFVLMMLAFYISLFPIINLETSFIGDSQSDRYGYIPSIFFILAFTFLLQKLLNKKVMIVLSLGLMIWFYVGVQNINGNWRAGSAIAEPLLKNFIPPVGTAYILNLPDNYNGTYMLRTGFADGISFLNEKDYTKKIKVLSIHPILSITDSVRVKAIGENTYKLQLLSPNNRFYMMDKFFINNRNLDLYSITENSETTFTVKFKKLESGDKLFYYSSGALFPLASLLP